MLATTTKGKYLTNRWTTFWVLLGVVLGGIFITIYGWCDEPINYGSALLWAGAYFLLGAFGGFIFGVPRIVSSSSASGSLLQQADLGKPPATQVDASPDPTKALSRKIIQENTNLTQISDWLTKVIIGAGLVQLKEIPGFVLKIARDMAKGISAKPGIDVLYGPTVMFSAAILIYFLVWGFLSGYLAMRLIIAALLASDED